MLDNYFSQYEQLIKPSKHTVRSITNGQPKSSRKSSNSLSRFDASSSKKISIKPKLPLNLINNDNDDFTCDNDEKSGELLDYKKMNMFLRQEVSSLKKKNKQLNIDINSLQKEVEEYKVREKKNCDYILMLEKVVDQLKAKSKKKQSFQKITNITTHNTSNTVNIIQNNNVNKDELIVTLQKENAKLKQFKNEIFNLSTQANDINTNAVIIMKQILNHFNEINSFYAEINRKGVDIDIDTEQTFYANIKVSTEQLIQLVIKDNKLKSEEYKLLLQDKDEEISKGNMMLKEREDLINELKEQIEDKDNKIIQLQNEADMWKRASTTSIDGKRKVITTKRINKSNSAVNINNSSNDNQSKTIPARSNVDSKIAHIKKTLNRTIKDVNTLSTNK